MNRFLKRYATELQRVRDCIHKISPDLVIGIARKGPRIIELCARFDSSLLPPRTPVISHKALSFLNPAEMSKKRIVVFDDAVIWGSTMKDVVTHACLDGAQVTPLSVVAAKNRARQLVPHLRCARELERDEVMCFS